jgi:hypothetical protein
MRWQKSIRNDVHSPIRQNSKTTNHKNKTQIGTQECWPARNINHLKATILRQQVHAFRGHNKSLWVFLFVCKGVWSQGSAMAGWMSGRWCDKLVRNSCTGLRQALNRKPSSQPDDILVQKNHSQREYSDFLAPRSMTTALTTQVHELQHTYLLRERATSPYRPKWRFGAL